MEEEYGRGVRVKEGHMDRRVVKDDRATTNRHAGRVGRK